MFNVSESRVDSLHQLLLLRQTHEAQLIWCWCSCSCSSLCSSGSGCVKSLAMFRAMFHRWRVQCCVCVCDQMCCVSTSVPAVLRGPPAEDGAAAAAAAAAAEAGALLPVQRGGPHAAHVHVRPARPLDGLRLVLHRPQGDREPGLLGHRSVTTCHNQTQR